LEALAVTTPALVACAFRSLALLAALLSPALVGCATFVSVDTSGAKPVFSWPRDAGVTSLVVMPVVEDCNLPKAAWWHLVGPITPPVTYGEVPPGATAEGKALPLSKDCDKWVVTISNGSSQSESKRFSP
jgi:hypothetical protein